MQENIWTRHVQGVGIASLLGIVMVGMAYGDCKPEMSGKINDSNSAITRVTAGNMGTPMAIHQDALGGIQVYPVSSIVTSKAMLGEGSSTVSLESTTNPYIQNIQNGEAMTIAYNPLTDPGLQDMDKPVDIDKVKDLTDKFQQEQWKLLDRKEQNLKNQPPAQPQPPEYLNKTNTTVTTPIFPAATPTAPITPTTTMTPTETPAATTETPTK